LHGGGGHHEYKPKEREQKQKERLKRRPPWGRRLREEDKEGKESPRNPFTFFWTRMVRKKTVFQCVHTDQAKGQKSVR